MEHNNTIAKQHTTKKNERTELQQMRLCLGKLNVCQMACKFRWVGFVVCNFQCINSRAFLNVVGRAIAQCSAMAALCFVLFAVCSALLLSHSKQVHVVIIVPLSKPITTANVLKLSLDVCSVQTNTLSLKTCTLPSVSILPNFILCHELCKCASLSLSVCVYVFVYNSNRSPKRQKVECVFLCCCT